MSSARTTNILLQNTVLQEAARRVFYGRLNPLLRAHGYTEPSDLLTEVYEKALSMAGKYDPRKGSNPAAYLAAGASRDIKKRLLVDAHGLHVPLSQPTDSAETRARKEAARAMISLDSSPGSTDRLVGAACRPAETVFGGLDPDFDLLGDEDEDCGTLPDPTEEEPDDAPDDTEDAISRAVGSRLESEEPAGKKLSPAAQVRLTQDTIAAWRDCGHPVLERLAVDLASLAKPDAWKQAVHKTAKHFSMTIDEVIWKVTQHVHALSLRSGNARRRAEADAALVATLLARTGTRGPYKKKPKKEKPRKRKSRGA